ncbi:Protein FAR1-RELATED SEQUENCE 12 [Linum perenne]
MGSCRGRLMMCSFDWYRLDDDNTTRLDERTVTFDFSRLTFECECRLFGSSGWLCRHILKSLDTLASSWYPAATSIPSQYIKKRWCKTAKIGFTLGVSISSREVPQSNRSRFEELSTFMISMAAEFHVDVEVYNKIKEDFLEVQSRGRTMLIERRTTMGHHPPSVPPSSSAVEFRDGQTVPIGFKPRKNPDKSKKRHKSFVQTMKDKYRKKNKIKLAASQARK